MERGNHRPQCSWVLSSEANKAKQFMGGKVHAIERNMEAGLLVRGGEAPRTLHRHLEALVSTNVLTVI